MNKKVVMSAIKAYRNAYAYELKVYKIIDTLTVYGGKTAYPQELGNIQSEAENIIKEEMKLDDDSIETESIMEDITKMIREKDKTSKEILEIIERFMNEDV